MAEQCGGGGIGQRDKGVTRGIRRNRTKQGGGPNTARRAAQLVERAVSHAVVQRIAYRRRKHPDVLRRSLHKALPHSNGQWPEQCIELFDF